MSLLGSLAGLLRAPEPLQGVMSYTVPVAVQRDGDEEAARQWLDESAERAGKVYAASQQIRAGEGW